MFQDLIYVGKTSFGYPVYDIDGIRIVDTGCGTESYIPEVFGELSYD